MNYETLKQQIDALDESNKKKYRKVLTLTTLGGAILPEFSPHADDAETYKDFFEAIYQDNCLKYTKAWAAYAEAADKNWLDRFDPTHKLMNVQLKSPGLLVQFSDSEMLIPTSGRGKFVNIYLFEDGELNTDPLELYASIKGTFTCDRLQFDGIYDIFKSGNSIIFERWQLNEMGERAKAAELARKYRKAS